MLGLERVVCEAHPLLKTLQTMRKEEVGEHQNLNGSLIFFFLIDFLIIEELNKKTMTTRQAINFKNTLFIKRK